MTTVFDAECPNCGPIRVLSGMIECPICGRDIEGKSSRLENGPRPTEREISIPLPPLPPLGKERLN